MKRFVACAVLVLLLICSPLYVTQAAGGAPRLVDSADLLDSSQEAQLLSQLDEISQRQQFDVVVVTVNSLGGKSAMDYADDFYDDGGYGYGDDRDGALLLVCMDERDWWVSTTGFGITAITDYGLENMSQQFLPDLQSGDYADAFATFAAVCDRFVTEARAGTPYDLQPSDQSVLVFMCLTGSLLLGALVALLIVTSMKCKLKSVRPQPAAAAYTKPGSLQMTSKQDLFLYHTVSRRPRPKDTGSSSGGSRTHTSSSGTRHGGGGGKF